MRVAERERRSDRDQLGEMPQPLESHFGQGEEAQQLGVEQRCDRQRKARERNGTETLAVEGVQTRSP